jgi:hypothetical protein
MILDKLAVFSGMATMWISDMVGSVVSSFEIGPVAACAIRSTGVAADNRLATDLYVSLKDYYGSIGEGFDVEAVATALEILARQEDKAPLVAVLKILVERQRQDETISGLTEAIRQLDARLKEIQGVMPARRGVAGSPRLQLPSPPQKPKIALMGRKTPFMHDQLGVFHRFLEEHGYTGNESILYAQAERCWKQKKIVDAWNRAKLAEGTQHGYSCPKALADAYRNLSREQKDSL